MESASEGCVETPETASMALLRLAAGGWMAQAVHVAAKLGIADALKSGPSSPADLAAAGFKLNRIIATAAGPDLIEAIPA